MNKKESPRLKWGSTILNKMGIKNFATENSIKIFGNPNLIIDKKIIINNYLNDHRVFMTSVIAALSFGGLWKIHDSKSIRTSFMLFSYLFIFTFKEIFEFNKLFILQFSDIKQVVLKDNASKTVIGNPSL